MSVTRALQLFSWNGEDEILIGVNIKLIWGREIAETQFDIWMDEMVGATDCFYFLSEVGMQITK